LHAAAHYPENRLRKCQTHEARITVKYADKIVVVPVVVTPNPAAAAKEARG
jgi:hypothetical protein